MARSRLVLAGIVVLAVGVAWLIRWGTDDAYISFTYARGLVRGDGLTWFGERVEGYTNFAWVLWAAAGIAAGIDPMAWAWAGSLAALALAVVATYRAVLLRTAVPATAACAAGLLAGNFTFLAFGTSGLETMLQTALLALAWWQVERIARGEAASGARLARLSLTSALAIWTRLDSSVICAVLAAVVVRQLARERAGIRRQLAAIAPAVLLVGGWLGWKLWYYGAALPNTFHAKVGLTGPAVVHGAAFVGAFLHAYLLWPALIAAAALAIAGRLRAGLPAAIAGAWLCYVALVGGDFMEFRFFVPAMPALFAIIAEAATAGPAPKLPSPAFRAVAVAAVLCALSWRHAAAFSGVSGDRTYDSVHAMATFYGVIPDGDWRRPGEALRGALAGTGATLACNGAGAIPYFADLPTIDQLGLNDAWIARHGVRPPDRYLRPGHQRFAPYDYLVARKVTFVIGSPTVVRRGGLTTMRGDRALGSFLSAFLGPAARPLPGLVVVAAPLDEHRALAMWYLTPDDAITARIRAAGWELRRFAN